MRTSIVFLTLIGALVQARADSVEDFRAAREHYETANAQYGLGNYAKAAEEYEASFALKHDPALLYNAAQSQRLAGNKARALLLYQNLVRVYAGKLDNAAEVKRHIAELEKAIAADENSRTSPPVAPLPPALPEPPAKTVAPAPGLAPAEPPVATKPILVETATASAPRPARRTWIAGVVVGVAVAVGAVVALGVTFGRPESHAPQASLGHVQAN